MNHYFLSELSLAKAETHHNPSLKKLLDLVLPDKSEELMKTGLRILDDDSEISPINDAIKAFLCKKGNVTNAETAIDNLIDQYGTPELVKQVESTSTFQQACDLIIKNKDIILNNISKS